MNFKDSELLLSKLSKLSPDNLRDDEQLLEDRYLFFMQKNLDAFKEQLRSIRKKHSKTQVEVAKYLGITQAAYSGVESGSIIPRIDFIKKLSDYYEEDPSVFLDFDKLDISGITESVPLFAYYDIESLSFEEFYSKLQELRNSARAGRKIIIDDPNHIPDIYFEVAASECIDFFYHVADDVMEPLVPKDSYVAFDIRSIKDVSLEEKLRITNNKIVLLSINNGPVMLRRVFFDGSIVTITDSNHRYPSRSFPIRNNEVIIKSVTDRISGDSSSNDSVITAEAITMYGIAKKVIREL
ncbi:helix-turn-helix domain-containing protein [Succinivibrio dextrinosolvens]|uniref:Helix-turn-helix n=1 Tax=Succinivibrio dextrinosolvens TaxID=83771 RepID=A0A662ZDL9_9GAMM|nr:helix-turn-helix transcriptional regulator [Succinivibrio dextrinosolvens]SFK61508.1 Helix-turn-helix [Succinivibrio dextrinosolvens]